MASAWPEYPSYATDLVPLDGVGRVRVGDVLVAFHDDVDLTEWLLTETRSFTADGRLLASKAVQAIVRPFDRPPEQLGRAPRGSCDPAVGTSVREPRCSMRTPRLQNG